VSRVRRTDRVAIGAVKRTPAGVLVVPASVSRTGLQTYKTHDGRERIEYRPESEVFAPAALESLKGAKVTIGHSADRPAQVGVGLVSDRDPAKSVRDGESFVDTSLLLTDRETIRRVELPPGDPQRLTEISLDYEADTDPTPGVDPAGRRYDARQTNITVYSVALLEAGGARAGREARIRLDGHEETCQDPVDPGSPATHPPEASVDPKTIVKIKLDGKEFVEGSPEHIGHLNAALEASKAETVAAVAKLATAEAATVTEKARADGLQTELGKVADKVPALVADELKFRAEAAALLPKDYKFDGKVRAEIKRDAIGAEACKRVDAQPEATRGVYLDSTFDVALATRKSGTPSYAPANPGVKRDSTDANPIAARSAKLFAEGRGQK
jgi:hypothetical protein